MRLSYALMGLFVVAPVSAALADCNQNSDQRAMNACAQEAYLKADGELSGLYRQLAERLKNDGSMSRLFNDTQKAWLAYRDAECGFATAGAAQGMAAPMLVAECREELTSKRADVLKYYLKCEGDLGCPLPSK